jgi:hypothetical protein
VKKTTWRFFATAWWVLPILAVPATPADEAWSASCKDCADWNATQAPFRIHGSTYYVGVRGLSSILITSDRGQGLDPTVDHRSAVSAAAWGRRLLWRSALFLGGIDAQYRLEQHVRTICAV